MKFFLFVDPKPNEYQSAVAKHLDEHFIFLVDSVHGGDKEWLKRNFSELQYLAYVEDGKNSVASVMVDQEYDEDGSEWESVVFVVCIQKGEEMNEVGVKALDQLCRNILSVPVGDFTVDVPDDLKLKLECITKSIVAQVPQESSYDYAEEPPKPKYTEYGFDYDLDTAKDICVCEIQKPNVELPYTVVLRHFARDGFTKLFTSLFICPSWGVAIADRLFLQALWDKLEMEGEFDLEKMLKEHTESCYPGGGDAPICEPEVYRLDLQDTIKQLVRKRKNMLE